MKLALLFALLLAGCASDPDRARWRADVKEGKMSEDDCRSLIRGQQALKEMQP
jgi:hypothetical protein